MKACDARIATPPELRETLASDGLEISFYGKTEKLLRRSAPQPAIVVRKR